MMLTYFHQHKLKYSKGQMAPFFILILVVLIIMAMVTLNLSKVASVKTDSSNAVDAGALAAGSVMANVFNALASANEQMIASYWMFFTTVSISFINALVRKLAPAMMQACPTPCTAVETIGEFIWATAAIIVAVIAYALAQNFFYRSIREMAERGRENAIKIGHRFAFINSGIGSKLKNGSPPDTITEPAKRKNYRDSFSDFLNALDDGPEYTYAWQDGQDRGHSVRVNTGIEPVEDYELRRTLASLPEVIGALAASIALAIAAKSSLTTACTAQETYLATMEACGCVYYCAAACAAAYAAWMAACVAAIAKMAGIFALMAAAWAGLSPGATFTSSSGNDALVFILCWIDAIDHNRLVRLETTQHHAGADLGLWQTRYPDTTSYSVADFTGNGSIYPPRYGNDGDSHDASIVDTDR